MSPENTAVPLGQRGYADTRLDVGADSRRGKRRGRNPAPIPENDAWPTWPVKDTETALWFTSVTCRSCGRAATHFRMVAVSPAEWMGRREMSVMAMPYCTLCSPAVAYWLLSKREKKMLEEDRGREWRTQDLRVTRWATALASALGLGAAIGYWLA